jgi:adenylyltransferase/sulfurtransferase
METDRHITVAGAGGVTGSHLLPLLARQAGLGRLTLVDPDVYSAANLAVQNIEPGDVGQSKVQAQAAKLRRINPRLDVVALAERIEDVPRGSLRCDLIVSCLDSKIARLEVNQLAFRLGSPWIDCGVLGAQSLVRVNAYVPALEASCIECPWGRDDYALLEQEYLCAAGGAARPTMASSALGALAASLVALEIAKVLAGDLASSAVGRQVIQDAHHHNLMVTKFRRNPNCQFDHRTWKVEPWRVRLESTTVGDTLHALGSLRVEGHRFVSALVCPGCGRRENSLRLNRPLARCPACGRRMATPGFDAHDRLDAGLGAEYRALTLAQVGLRADDLVSAGDWHYQLKEAE